MRILKFSKYITKKLSFILFLGFIFSYSITTISAQKKYTVVLDAGHGGKDYGASRGGYIEKKIALSLALKTGEILKKDKDLNIIYTRKKDVFIELHNRARIANEKNADLFVSIHCNANNSSRPHGAETYVLGLRGNKENLEIVKKENEVILLEDDYRKNYDYDPNSPETVIALSVLQEENLDMSLAFGGLVQRNFRGIKRYDRKVKQANFLVLRETVMPSVLIELGFISNKVEGQFLNSRSGQYKMAKAISEAIKKYIKQIKINSVGELPIDTTKKEEEKTTLVKTKVKPKEKKEEPKKVVVAKTKESKKVSSPKKKEPKKEIKRGVYFRVQIAASRNKLSNNFNFKGLSEVESSFIEGYYKYYYGQTSDFQEVKRMQSKAREVGHKGAFVVAFKDGKKISVKEALNSL
ncbi:N-acetylmuramoyl-L-alanine amidase [Tenacibaculum sp. MAR_2009_124]|uniref:N-acetylmuramoyl-L-alanine amidase family protein n=1 Tax=Tenacibaculum sp. MAR_2009_124 TaxID=1250059 RepID=UPI000897B53D|nr:N-acetylmuramoyl-L-alanine amidase [Tenacibaculum sp. MAR_2009_124]SEC91775.1 N-acetylmuramoyl-L-alanine amidase [Tenacibaculum sp. MAR_2009_124]